MNCSGEMSQFFFGCRKHSHHFCIVILSFLFSIIMRALYYFRDYSGLSKRNFNLFVNIDSFFLFLKILHLHQTQWIHHQYGCWVKFMNALNPITTVFRPFQKRKIVFLHLLKILNQKFGAHIEEIFKLFQHHIIHQIWDGVVCTELLK